jgi:hypothetical protein
MIWSCNIGKSQKSEAGSQMSERTIRIVLNSQFTGAVQTSDFRTLISVQIIQLHLQILYNTAMGAEYSDANTENDKDGEKKQ